MIETGMVLDKHGEILFYHMPDGRNTGSLPDSSVLWEVLWTNRHWISGFAHTHPGIGYPQPSHTDLTTFAAIETGLGMRLDWWIVTENRISLVQFTNYFEEPYQTLIIPTDAFPWVASIRKASRMGE